MVALDGPRWGPKSGEATRHLVVLLHGVAADGHNLITLAPSLGPFLPHAVFVAPHAPFAYDLASQGAGAERQWFSLSDRTLAAREAGVRVAAPYLDAFLDAELHRLGLPPDAYALLGFSQGAMMALFTGLRRRHAPRAVLGFSGLLVAPDRVAQQMLGRPPVLLVHGSQDPVLPASLSRDAARVLRAAGLSVRLIERPALAHAMDEVGLAAAGAFLQQGFAGAVPVG